MPEENAAQPGSDDGAGAAKKPPSEREDALAVLRRLREAGHGAYFAGGCVRDLLLGRSPKDYDIATDAPPTRVRELFSNTQAVGAAFGVILVRHRRSVIEVATFRAEAGYHDGRHPSEVRFTTAEEDAKRRDFTINGLFLDPIDDRVIDYVGGQEDLKAGVIRAIGVPEERFKEDHLRLLRAVRFAARFGFVIEPATESAIVRHAPQLVRISPERIAEELRITLTPTTRERAYRMLDRLGLRELIFRFFEKPTNPGEQDHAVSVFAAIAPERAIPFGLALAAASLDHQLWRSAPGADVPLWLERAAVQKRVRALRQSLKISNEESDAMQGAIEGLAPLLRDEPPSVATMKRFLARPTSGMSRDLLEALGRTVLKTPRVAELAQQLAQLEKSEVAPPPLITGDDLTAAGFAPGPIFKRVLDAVYDAQLEDRIRTRKEGLELAVSLARGNQSA